MDNIEFGKRIQQLSEDFKELTGEDLKFTVNEETGFLSSRVYSGEDYPKRREELLYFMNNKINEYYMKDKLVFIDPIFTSDNIVHSSCIYFKLDNNKIKFFDLLDWYVFPFQILEFYINYLKGEKDYTISVWEEEDGPYLFKIYNDKTYLCLNEEIHEDDYILLGSPKEQAKEVLSHFKKYVNEWEKGCETNGEIKKLCEELETLL